MKIYNVEKLSVVQERKQEEKQREENIKKVPVIEDDVTEVAITTAFVLEDTMATAETVAFLLSKFVEMEAEIEQLKGGGK